MIIYVCAEKILFQDITIILYHPSVNNNYIEVPRHKSECINQIMLMWKVYNCVAILTTTIIFHVVIWNDKNNNNNYYTEAFQQQQQQPPTKKVVVIGGGWAGYSVADALSTIQQQTSSSSSSPAAAFDIEILDASPRGPGGLAGGWRTPKLNKPVESGIHGFWREYKNTFAVIEDGSDWTLMMY